MNEGLNDKVVKLLIQGITHDSEEINVRQPLIRAIEQAVEVRMTGLNKLSTAELIKLHEKLCD